LRKDADLIVDTTALRAVEAAHLIADAWAGSESLTPLIRRSFRTAPLAAPTELGRQAGSPCVTADDPGFPLVLAQWWHGQQSGELFMASSRNRQPSRDV
jgi:hypothetical protein